MTSPTPSARRLVEEGSQSSGATCRTPSSPVFDVTALEGASGPTLRVAVSRQPERVCQYDLAEWTYRHPGGRYAPMKEQEWSRHEGD